MRRVSLDQHLVQARIPPNETYRGLELLKYEYTISILPFIGPYSGLEPGGLRRRPTPRPISTRKAGSKNPGQGGVTYTGERM